MEEDYNEEQFNIFNEEKGTKNTPSFEFALLNQEQIPIENPTTPPPPPLLFPNPPPLLPPTFPKPRKQKKSLSPELKEKINKARRARRLQKKKYQEWQEQLDKDKYTAQELVDAYNKYFSSEEEEQIDVQSFGQLKETKIFFDHKRKREKGKLITFYTKKGTE